MKNSDMMCVSSDGARKRGRRTRFLKCMMTLAVVALLCCMLLAFVACGDTPVEPEQNDNDSDGPNPEYPEPKPSAPDITVAQLVENYPAKAKSFVADEIEPLVFEDKTILSKRCSIAGDKTVTAVNILYFCATNARSRDIVLANVKLRAAVDADDIAAARAQVPANGVEIVSTTLMTFDAKTNKTNAELRNALYEALGLENEDVKLFTAVAPDRPGYKYFQIYTMDEDNTINLYRFGVQEGDGSDETILKNIQAGKIVDNSKKSYKNEGAYVGGNEYDLNDEKFEGQGPVVDPDNPEIPDPPSKVTDAELVGALQQNCAEQLNNFFQNNFEIKFNAEKVEKDDWLINVENDKITEITYTLSYNRSSTSRYIIVLSAELDEPLSKDDIKSGVGISNVKLSQKYFVSYNPEIQETNAELADAIFEALGVEDTGATRIIIDQGGGVDPTLGEVQYYKVVEISNNAINEYSIKVKRSGTSIKDNLQNGQFEELTGERKAVEINGEKLSSEVTDAELLEALQQNYKSELVKKALMGLNIKQDKITNENWYLNTQNDKVVGIDYVINYNNTSTSKYFIVTSLTFDNAITKEDLKNGKLNSSIQIKYSIEYNPTIQETNAELTDAIFKALGVEDTGATRIIIDGGHGIDDELGECLTYKVVEISDNEIREYAISIKSTGDTIKNNLKNGYFKEIVSSRKAVEINGEKLVAE